MAIQYSQLVFSEVFHFHVEILLDCIKFYDAREFKMEKLDIKMTSDACFHKKIHRGSAPHMYVFLY